MSAKSKNQLVKKLFSMAGIASASVFFCLPGFAEVTPNPDSMNQPSNNQIESPVETEPLIAQNTSRNNNTCGGYEGNATSGGGFYCARRQLFPNGGAERTAPAESSYRDNGGSTTGAGYPGNNVTPQGAEDNTNR